MSNIRALNTASIDYLLSKFEEKHSYRVAKAIQRAESETITDFQLKGVLAELEYLESVENILKALYTYGYQLQESLAVQHEKPPQEQPLFEVNYANRYRYGQEFREQTITQSQYKDKW